MWIGTAHRGLCRGRSGRGQSPVLLHHLDGEVIQLASKPGCKLSQHLLHKRNILKYLGIAMRFKIVHS